MSELFRNVLNASFQGGIVIAAVLLLRLVLRKAPKKYACLLWILAGLRLLCPFTIESEMSLQPQEQIVTQSEWEDLRSYGQVFPENPLTEAPQVDVPEVQEAPVTSEELAAAPGITVTVKTEINWAEIAPYLWIAGVAALGIYSLISYLRLKRRVREAVHLFDRVWECAGIDTAFILGFLKPRIYIPMGLPEGSRRFILEHERAHLNEGDHWVKLIGFAALAVHWFNPLAWGAYILLCRDMEMACDERVVRDMNLEERKRYSSALLECSSTHRSIAACPVAFGEVSVKQRILGVLNYRKKSFWFSLVAIAAIVFVAVCFLTNPAKSSSEKWEDECRAVLEEIQSRDAYAITEQRHFEGDAALNDSADFSFFRYGDNWLTIEYIDDMAANGWIGYLHLGGEYFEAVSDEAVFDWQPTDLTEFPEPWLYSFDMDAQEVRANSRKVTSDGYEIRLLVSAPYFGLGDSYYVDFCFDPDGNFLHAIQYVSGMEEYMGEMEEETITSTIYALETTEAEILSTMQSYAGNVERDFDLSLGVATLEDPDSPDWGVTLSAVDVTPTGLELVCTRSGGAYPGDLLTGREWWLEQLVDGEWVALEPVQDLVWFTDAQVIQQGGTYRWNCSLEWAYGVLEPGTYRIGKTISNVVEYRVGADPSIAEHNGEESSYSYYAEFVIGQDTDAALEKCKAALEAFQKQETYAVQVEGQYTGDILNDSSTLIYYQDGDDWMYQLLISGADQSVEDWALEKNSVQYERGVSIIHNPANGESSDSGWSKTELNENEYMPWVISFDWDAAQIEFVSEESGESKDTVTFIVRGTPYSDELPQDAAVDNYTVRFEFYAGTNTLRDVVLSYTETWPMLDGSNGAVSVMQKTSLHAMAPEDAAAAIDRVYAQEIAGA